jgi:hypothetical protein
MGANKTTNTPTENVMKLQSTFEGREVEGTIWGNNENKLLVDLGAYYGYAKFYLNIYGCPYTLNDKIDTYTNDRARYDLQGISKELEDQRNSRTSELHQYFRKFS